jgi:hypothetical protein
MADVIAEELTFIPELPAELAELDAAHHPAFANVAAAEAASCDGSAYLSCDMLPDDSWKMFD